MTPPAGETSVVTALAALPRYTAYDATPETGCHASSTAFDSARPVAPAGAAGWPAVGAALGKMIASAAATIPIVIRRFMPRAPPRLHAARGARTWCARALPRGRPAP